LVEPVVLRRTTVSRAGAPRAADARDLDAGERRAVAQHRGAAAGAPARELALDRAREARVDQVRVRRRDVVGVLQLRLAEATRRDPLVALPVAVDRGEVLLGRARGRRRDRRDGDEQAGEQGDLPHARQRNSARAS
jgi:hypothetical protein